MKGDIGLVASAPVAEFTGLSGKRQHVAQSLGLAQDLAQPQYGGPAGVEDATAGAAAPGAADIGLHQDYLQ